MKVKINGTWQDVAWASSNFAGYREVLTTLPSSGTVTIDFSESNSWFINPTSAVSVVFTNLPAAGFISPGTLIVANSDHVITWPAGTRFPGGVEPELDGETWISIAARQAGVTVGAAWAGVE
jgi:hypothetical protein